MLLSGAQIGKLQSRFEFGPIVGRLFAKVGPRSVTNRFGSEHGAELSRLKPRIPIPMPSHDLFLLESQN